MFLDQQRAVMGRADARGLLSTINCPTIVIHGADDRLIPSEMGEECATAIPGAEFVIIEDAGHFVFREQPDSTACAVADFLDKVNSIH